MVKESEREKTLKAARADKNAKRRLAYAAKRDRANRGPASKRSPKNAKEKAKQESKTTKKKASSKKSKAAPVKKKVSAPKKAVRNPNISQKKAVRLRGPARKR